MAQQKNTRLERHQLQAIEDMVDRGIADNESEAHRMLLNAGKREYGYKNGGYTDTMLRLATFRVGVLLAIAGIVGLAFTFAYPVSARLPSFAVLVVGAGLYGVSSVLERHEPQVSQRLKGLLGRDSA
jgi:hypothetical protein